MTFSKRNKGTGIETVYDEIGRRLRWLREQRGWSARDVGERLDIHPSTIAAWENSIARVGIAEVLRIVHAIGVPISTVLADLDIGQCQPPPGQSEKRKETARKRVQAMRANGTLGPGARSKAKDGKGAAK